MAQGESFTDQIVAASQSRMEITLTTWPLGNSIVQMLVNATTTGRMLQPVSDLISEQAAACRDRLRMPWAAVG